MDDKWKFFEELKNYKAELAANANNSTQKLYEIARDCLVADVGELHQVRCKSCTGFGHTSEKCPTAERIRELSAIAGVNVEVLPIAGGDQAQSNSCASPPHCSQHSWVGW